MSYPQPNPKPDEAKRLDIFCSKVDSAWRIYVRPARLPRHLARCFDSKGEAYPVLIDLPELDRLMEARGVKYLKVESTDGSVEIEATGPAAQVLVQWLSRLFESNCQATLG